MTTDINTESSSTGAGDSHASLIKLLVEDLQSHREHVQKLYRNAFIAGGVLAAIGVGLAFWLLGEQLDSRVFEYRIVDSLKQRAETISNEIVKDAEVSARNSVDSFIKNSISKEVDQRVKDKLEDLNDASLKQLVEQIGFPVNSIIAVDASTCPSGWENYIGTEGRYIVGVGPGGNVGAVIGDPLKNEENRAVGKHTHQYGFQSVGGNGSFIRYGSGASRSNTQQTTSDSGEVEGTNAPYIQLLFCKKT